MHDSSPAARRFHVPLPALLMVACGVAGIVFGMLLLAGIGRHLHPLLDGDGAGIALLVSGVALAGSGLFPVAFAWLAAQDGDAQ